MKPHTPLAERLWSRVVRTGDDDCWEWVGPKTNGYGVISAGGRGGRILRAHRVAYELTRGEIPDAMQIDHLCNTRACCNPAHLEVVTQAENLRRAGERRTTCPQSHPLPPRQPGKRRPGCPTCARIRYQAKKAVA